MYIKNRKDNHFSEVQDNYKIAQLATKINWQPVYSDAYTLKNGEYQRYRLNIWQFFVLFFFSYKFQVKMPNNMVWYPFATKKGYLSFSYRSDNGFNQVMRRKQWLMIVAGAVNLVQPFNRPQLAFEKT